MLLLNETSFRSSEFIALGLLALLDARLCSAKEIRCFLHRLGLS